MRLLADENIPRGTVVALLAASFDVAWIKDIAPGICDQEVIEIAEREDRVILTLDKDFGELAVKRGLGFRSGVVLIRLSPPTQPRVTSAVLELLQTQEIRRGEIIVLEEGRIRRKPIGRSEK